MNVHRTVSFILFLFATALLFVSCNNTERSMFKADNGLQYDTITITEQYHLDGDTTKPSCNIDLSFVYPVVSQKMNTEDLQKLFVQNVFGLGYESLLPHDAAKDYVKNYIENYNKDAATYRETADEIAELNAMIPDIHIDDSENVMEKYYYSYFENLSDSIVYDNNDVLSFQVKQSNSKGGADSYSSYRNYVVNLKSGTLLTENDIFNAGYNTALQSLFLTSLLDQNKVKTVADLEDLGFFGVEEMMPNRNFLVNGEGITYTFNKGEYSAYQLSAPEIFIPYSTIRSLLRKNTVVSKLAGL